MAVIFLTDEDEKKFVKTINNMQPDENGNVKIAIDGQDVDLTGYATEKWVQEGYQPKGSYLTKVPDEYATEEFVIDKIAEAEIGGKEVDLSGYAKKSELPTKVSQLDNDKGYLTEHQDISGKLDANKLPEAINTALAQAKDSGKFDGKDYVLTENDKNEIAEIAADLVDIPEYEDNSDEVYILGDDETIEDAPPDAIIVVSRDGEMDFDSSNTGGNVDLTGYATEQFVRDGFQPKGDYLESTELTNAVNTALAQAKASGEFDGADGKDGADGYTPVKGVDYFDGQPGKDGEPGADGKDYVLTEADKTEIAELAADLVDVPSGGGGSGGSGAEWRYIGRITAEEEVGTMELTKDLDGNSFALNEVWCVVKVARGESSTTTTGTLGTELYSVGNFEFGSIPFKEKFIMTMTGAPNGPEFRAFAYEVGAWGAVGGFNFQKGYSVYSHTRYNKETVETGITRVKLRVQSTTETFAPGSYVDVYGR